MICCHQVSSVQPRSSPSSLPSQQQTRHSPFHPAVSQYAPVSTGYYPGKQSVAVAAAKPEQAAHQHAHAQPAPDRAPQDVVTAGEGIRDTGNLDATAWRCACPSFCIIILRLLIFSVIKIGLLCFGFHFNKLFYVFMPRFASFNILDKSKTIVLFFNLIFFLDVPNIY